MATHPLPPSSPEQRAAALVKAKQARRERIAAGAHYRRDFLDAPYWAELARSRSVRLPAWHLGPTPALMRRWLRILHGGVPEYLDWAGEKNLREFAERNEHWPARAWVGLVLEAVETGALACVPLSEEH